MPVSPLPSVTDVIPGQRENTEVSVDVTLSGIIISPDKIGHSANAALPIDVTPSRILTDCNISQ